MKLKNGVEPIWSDEPHYDLFDGGYLNPEKFLENEKDIVKVREAIETIEEYLGIVVLNEDECDE